jgi:hypothetical protein
MNSKKSSKKSSKKCSKGYIKRNSYTTKTGTKVKSKCIIARSASGEKTSDKLKKYLKEKMYRQKQQSKQKSKCSSKKIKNGSNVKANWITPGCVSSSSNKKTMKPQLITLMEKDVLEPFGYKHIEFMTLTERKNALKKAIRNIKPLSIYRRLIAIATLNKNKNSKLYTILRDDAEWIKTQSEYINDMAKKSSKKSSKKTSKK